MISGFDFLGFQAIKRFPTKHSHRTFLHVMQSTITRNSFLLVFYSYVLVFHPYVTGMYLVCTRMLLVCTRMYSYVTRMYLYVTRMYSCGVLVTIPLQASYLVSFYPPNTANWIMIKTPHEYIQVTYKYIRVTYKYIRVTYEYIRVYE